MVQELAGSLGLSRGSEPAENVGLPESARIAVTVQIALEAWSGTSVSGSVLGTPLSRAAIEHGTPDWATISAQEYGGNTGAWRLLDVLSDLDIAASWSISSLAGTLWPDAVKAVVASGHEVVGHGRSQDESMSDLTESEDLAVVSEAASVFQEIAGVRPYGWSSHGSRRNSFTVSNLLRCGYIYTNDFRDADSPYVVSRSDGRALIAMPRTDEINDLPLLRRHRGAPSAYIEYFVRTFDRLYQEGSTYPKVASLVLHSTVAGHAWGASMLEACIEHARRFDDVLICTRERVARHYAACVGA